MPFIRIFSKIMVSSGALTIISFLPHPVCGIDFESKPRRLCIHAW